MRWGPSSLCLFAALAGCGLETASEADPRTDALQGRAFFERDCAACHGADGKGGGTASLGLGVAPPDLTRFTKLTAGVLPRDRIMSTIDGFNRQTHWENPMPVFGDESLGAVVQIEENGISTPVPADLRALAPYLESIQE